MCLEVGNLADRIQVTVTMGEKQVTIEGPEGFVRAEVQRLTNMAVASAANAAMPGQSESQAPTSERAFIAQKKPNGHAETVAVLGYFLTKAGQEEFTPEDVRRAYARAGARPPKVIAQALRDAKNIYDYLQSGTARGTFRLTPHGERTVEFDLPANEVS